MKIFCQNNNEPVVYAAEELKKYAKMMCPLAEVTIQSVPSEDCIQLGLLRDLGLSAEGVDDSVDCDYYDVKIDKGVGYIAGSNPRSVLYGVYAFLKSGGCRWGRPGKDGEYVPDFDIVNHSFAQTKKAAYPIREQMIEGAISYEHVHDAIVWLPKVGYNSFCVQFVYPYSFFKRWYNHEFNTRKKPEDVSYEQIEEMVHDLEALMRRCGLMIRSLVHAYLFEPYGVRYYGRPETVGVKYEIPEENKQYAALVKGKRDVYKGSINYTQLCFSNPKVRKDCTDYIISFVKERKPDIIHLSIADGTNNYCECEECVKKLPSEWHLMFLNEVDAALTAAGFDDVKISFGLYVNLLWPPKTERFNNPERFRLGIRFDRSFSKPLTAERRLVPIPEYKRNDFNVVLDNDLSLSFVEAWKPIYSGKYSMTSYNLYMSHFSDPGYWQLAKRTAEDINVFPQIPEIGGMISIMTQRFGMPTALPATVFGEFLFDPTLNFESFADQYFLDTFGEDGDKAKAYLEEISNLFDPKMLEVAGSIVKEDTGTGEIDDVKIGFVNNPDVQEKLGKVSAFVDSFEATIDKNMSLENPCHKKSWEILKYHAEYCRRFSAFYLALSRGEVDMAEAIFDELMDWLFSVEDIIAPHFDVYLLNKRTRVLLKRIRAAEKQ